MADNNVKIVISAVDKATGTLKGLTGGMKGVSTAFQEATGISLGAAAGIGAVGLALKEGIKFTKESINETVAYNKTIREMSQVTGLGSDSISRIVQVGDDWGISIDAIRTSLAFMNKQGITPSIDQIAKLADEYVNTADKSAFAEKAVKVLGRGYQTLIPLLALGGDGFRKAAAGVEKNLIVTEDSIKASREYEVALDTLQDAMTGLKYTVGNQVIPVMTDLMQILLGTYDASKAAEDGISNLDKTMGNLDKGIDGVGLAWNDYRQILYLATHGTLDMIKTGRTWNDELKYSHYLIFGVDKKLIDLRDTIHELDKGERDNINTTDDLSVAYDTTLASALSDAREDMGGMTDNEIYAQIVGLEGLKKAAEEYSGALQSLTTDALTGMSEGMGELMRKQALLTFFQAEKGTPELYAAALATYNLATANGWQLSNVEKLIKANKDKKISDIDMMAIMADNIVTNEELATALAKTAGEAGTLATNTGLAHAALHDMDGTVSTTTIITNHIDQYTEVRNPDQRGPHATGANYIVPPGYDRDNYPLGTAQSGERVIIIPKNQVTNNTFNYHSHSNASSSMMMRDFNSMKAWAN